MRETPEALFTVGEVDHVLESDEDKANLKTQKSNCVRSNSPDGEATNSKVVVRDLADEDHTEPGN